jgi:hypothetical protein
MNPAALAEMQIFAVLFRVHKFQSFDPFSMNERAMNRSNLIHRCCTHAKVTQQQICKLWIVFQIESSDVLMAAGWDQAASHSQHPFYACFRIQFELKFLSTLNVNRATYCL